MSNDLYDVLKMQMDEAVSLVQEERTRQEQSCDFNQQASRDLQAADAKLNETKALLESMGISLSEELSSARERASREAEQIIREFNEDKGAPSTPSDSGDYDIYEILVERAHARGYADTELQDLLSAEEIERANERYERIEEEFRKKTKLNRTDIVFLVTAIALQAIRQYVLDPMIKEHRPKAGADDEKGHSNKSAGWYRVPTKEILTNTVPFDAIIYSDNSTIKGFLKGAKNHRDVTLGHDPLLGWIFGTANIMTGTITNKTFDSAHIKYVPGKGNVIHSQADTIRIFTTVLDRTRNEGVDGVKALAYALVREGVHLKSDVGTKHSLPLPGINVLSPSLGDKLVEYGIDTGSVMTEMSLSMLINSIISMVHRIIKPEEEPDKMYAVRTRKILLLSNVIASTSNVLAVGIAAGIGVAGENPDLVKKSINYLDVGGLLVTISRLFTDIRFITKVKEEFITYRLNEELLETIDNLDSYLDV